MKTLLVAILLVSQAVSANEDVVYLPKGTQTPYTGYLFSEQKAQEVRVKIIDLEAATRTIQIMTDENALMVKRLELSKEHIDHLSKQVVSNDSLWGKMGYFFLGAAAASLVAFGASRAVRGN
jgi:hypothetical protein